MLTLVLTRHAKSDWGEPNLSDHDRPLNARGLHDAPRMGAWLKGAGVVPAEALISTATRARQTWDGLEAGLQSGTAPAHIGALYHAAPHILLSHIAKATAEVVILVAHNPGIAACAADLLATHPNHPRFDDYPTCATLVASFSAQRWRDVTWGSGQVTAFATPHDLA